MDDDFEIPVGHFACNGCGTSGEAYDDDGIVIDCEVCKGKGYYSPKDIDDYHKAYPEICKLSCGHEHHTPSEAPYIELEGVPELMKAADTILAELDDQFGTDDSDRT